MSIKLNIYLLYEICQQNQCLSIKKHDVHDIHRFVWGPYTCGAPRQLPNVPMRYDSTDLNACSLFIKQLQNPCTEIA